MRQNFFISVLSLLIITAVIYFYFNVGLLFMFVLVILLLIGFFNSTQHKHAILRNFPVLGYFRHLFEMIAPEIQQYFIERSTDENLFQETSVHSCTKEPKTLTLVLPLEHN